MERQVSALSRFGQKPLRSPRMTFRTAAEWIALLQRRGFGVSVESIDGRSMFANVLLHAQMEEGLSRIRTSPA